MNPPRSAGDGRQEIQLTAMVPIERPVLGNLACRLVVKILIRVAGVKEHSVPAPVPRRSAPAVVPKAEVEYMSTRSHDAVSVLLKRKKQKARPKGVNLKVRWRAKVAMRYCSE